MAKARIMPDAEDYMERMCIVTRARRDPAELLRFVLDPEGTLVPDLKAKLPGRGAWVTAQRAILDQAVDKRAFRRAFPEGTGIKGLETVGDRTEEALRKHALGALGLARKSGLVISGFSKVETAVKKGSVQALVHALDAGADGQQKLDRLAGHWDVPVFCLFSSEQMGFSLGREHVVHAALQKGAGAAHFAATFQRLATFVAN